MRRIRGPTGDPLKVETWDLGAGMLVIRLEVDDHMCLSVESVREDGIILQTRDWLCEWV